MHNFKYKRLEFKACYNISVSAHGLFNKLLQ